MYLGSKLYECHDRHLHSCGDKREAVKLSLIMDLVGRRIKDLDGANGFHLPNCYIKTVPGMGKGVFAFTDIAQDDLIADWSDGTLYKSSKATQIPDRVVDHAIQFCEDMWVDTEGIGRNINHSCMPNVTFSSTFQVRAMRDIKAGEQIFLDYETFEDSDWRMEECRCGRKCCRKVIGACSNLSEEERSKRARWLHPWLREKYNL